MDRELFEKLQEIFDYGVFELHPSENNEYYIPYMMNDQLEWYLVLENCRMNGEYLPELASQSTGELIVEDGCLGMIVRQGEENIFTLWFSSIRKAAEVYRYHEIGHFWVEGQEQWRQLVYIVGTIYDKYEYIGEEALNEKEQQLVPLMECYPFRYWSPIHEDLDEKYPDTEEGILCMEELAKAAGDRIFLGLLKWYRKFPYRSIGKTLALCLQSPKRQTLYQLIYDRICEASKEYPARDYGSVMNERIQKERQNVQEILEKKGYQGNYPHFQKEKRYVLAVEEHPFTRLEAENYGFRIQFMVSECDRGTVRQNGGFFKGKGRRGWIETEMEQL